MWIDVGAKKDQAGPGATKEQRDPVGNTSQAIGNTGFLSISNREEAVTHTWYL